MVKELTEHEISVLRNAIYDDEEEKIVAPKLKSKRNCSHLILNNNNFGSCIFYKKKLCEPFNCKKSGNNICGKKQNKNSNKSIPKYTSVYQSSLKNSKLKLGKENS